MPYTIFKRLGLGDLTPTRISLQLVDRSIKYPMSILEDVPIKVGDFYVPIDFVVLDMAEDYRTQIILGRPFLATVGCKIDVKEGKLTFDVANIMWSLDYLMMRNLLLLFPAVDVRQLILMNLWIYLIQI